MTDIATLKHPRPSHAEVEDVQGRADTRRIPINRVGIKDIAHPVRVKDRSEGEQHTIATFNMYVNLPHNFKGTHMSRFFVMKKAPVSGVESLMDYKASLIGEQKNGKAETWIKVVVPVTSLCPCSKK